MDGEILAVPDSVVLKSDHVSAGSDAIALVKLADVSYYPSGVHAGDMPADVN